MAAVDPHAALGALVTERPARARIFEDLGLDYCCGGRQSLDEACASAGVAVDDVVALLDADADAAAHPDETWRDAGITELVDGIEATHHAFLRTELPRLRGLAAKVVGAHGARHPELADVESTLLALIADMEPHLMKEERILFPMCRELDAASEVPSFHCGSLGNPISVMRYEHDEVGTLLVRLHELTAGYEAPADACGSYRALYDGLRELEADTHLHIHKENNVLFPKVLEREALVGS